MEQDFEALLADPLEPIVTRRLVLRAPVPTDAAAMARLANDRGLAMMMARLPHPYERHHAEAFLESCDQELVFAVTCRDDGVFMGMCGVRATPKPSLVDLGYWIGRPFWGKGYTTEAAQAVIDLSFTRLGVERVTANCRAINLASRRVLEKCGFQHRGTGTFLSVVAGRVASEDFTLDRRAWASLKAWGRD